MHITLPPTVINIVVHCSGVSRGLRYDVRIIIIIAETRGADEGDAAPPSLAPSPTSKAVMA